MTWKAICRACRSGAARWARAACRATSIPSRTASAKLRSVNRGGSVWATFAEDAPSFEDYCGPEVLAEIDHMLPGKPLKLLGYSRQLIPSNWKMYLENLKDPYHATLLHTFYITFGLWRADSKSECIPTGGGAHSVMVSHNEGKKKTEATTEMSRFREDLELLDLETVTPRAEFNRGRVGGAWVFPAAQFGIRPIRSRRATSFRAAPPSTSWCSPTTATRTTTRK